MNENDFEALSAGYALNALSPADRRAFESALAAHPEWAERVRTDVDTVAILADSTDPVAPPAGIRANLLAQIAATPQDGPDATEPQNGSDAEEPQDGPDAEAPHAADIRDAASPAPASGRARRTWFTLAASLALVAALGVGGAVIWQQVQPPAAVIALEQIQQAPDVQSAEFTSDGLAATAYWSAEVGQAVLVSDGLPVLTDDQTFELWYVRDGAPISAGTFSASAGDATAVLAGTMEQGDIIAVTVEPAGGSPTGAPSSDPIVAIET